MDILYSNSSASTVWIAFYTVWATKPLAEIFAAHMSGGGAKKTKNYLINFLAISGDSKHFLCLKKKEKKGRGVSQILFTPNLIFFVS